MRASSSSHSAARSRDRTLELFERGQPQAPGFEEAAFVHEQDA